MRRVPAAAALAVLLVSLARPEPAEVEREPLRFNRDVRPLLSDRCFPCHGFDANARKARLRLDTWDGLTEARRHGPPVAPGDPSGSALLRRIDADDPDRRMPPPESGLSLAPAEREVLRRWVAEGAPFERHWGFVAPTTPEVPAVGDEAWPRTEVDRFVLAELERRGLAPSPDADQATLVRRIHLDLTGLPPTPEELDAYLADGRPDRYERRVDALLDSPRFGERMALVWLDAARYADTNGFHHDNVRTIWPYRDWVIRAFTENLPYDRFVVEQLAGDLLPDATTDQRIATAFCRMHNINDEGGALDPEYRVEAVADRIETVATSLMGLTFTCARCHDHKYDPITQDDYYSLFAYFNSVDERGVYPNDFEQARAYPARLLFRPPDLDARLAVAARERDAAAAALSEAEPEIAAELGAWEEAFRRDHAVEWVDAALVDVRSAEGSTPAEQPDGSVRFEGDRPGYDTHTFTLRTDARDLNLVRYEALTDPSHPKESVGWNASGNAVVSAIRAVATSVADPDVSRPIEWAWAWADHEQPNGDFDVLNATGAHGDGWALAGHQRIENRTALLVAAEPFGFDGGTDVTVTIEYRSRYGHHVVGRPRVSLARAAPASLEAFPLVASDWWQAGPFTGDDFEALLAARFGPEDVRSIDRDHRFGDVPWRHRPDLVDGVPHRLDGERRAFYFARTLRTPVPRALALSLGSDDAIQVYLNGEEVLANPALRGVAPDQDRVTVAVPPGESVLCVKIVNNAGPAGFYHAATPDEGTPGLLAPAAFVPADRRDAALSERFLTTWGRERSPTYAALAGEVERTAAAVAALEEEAVPVLVMKENEEPTPTFVLARGAYDGADPDRPVERRPPALFDLPLPDGAPNDRLGFARWLVRDDHPLTARVHVNRLWQMLFGVGLVATAENFGRQADWPSHPDLLDWLATRFVAEGWDQKRLLRRLVTSSAYRQSSVATPAAAAGDPDGRLLTRFPRRRLPAELIRDQALHLAGLLVDRVGGPSVRPYQPDGLWREVSIGGSSNTQVFRRDEGDALWRRSLYTFWKRTSPNPQMTTFDAPSRETCVVRRGVTNTPLQALVLWNDEQFVEAARALAQRTLAEAAGRTDDERVTAMFRRATGRTPTTAESTAIGRTLDAFRARFEGAPDDAAALLAVGEAPLPDGHDPAALAAWTLVANTILSLDETIVRD
ncbi:MAG: DUF1553 domain-containing protein [Planctomycetota bacterium JB042]